MERTMLMFGMSLLVGFVRSVPVPQRSSLTLSEFRADSGRSFAAPSSNYVIISPSYRQVRRQGRKGDTRPIKISTPLGGPNELNIAFIGKEKEEYEEESGPIFDSESDTKLSTEEIKSKIEEINDNELQDKNMAAAVSETINEVTQSDSTPLQTNLDLGETTTIAQEITETTTVISEVIDDSTLVPEIGDTTTESFENSDITTDSSENSDITTKTPEKSEVVSDPDIATVPKRIFVAIRSAFIADLDLQTISQQIEYIHSLSTKVVLNEPGEVIQNEFRNPTGLIFLDTQIGPDNDISGNVYSNSNPLENLQGEEYEEALSVLTSVSKVLEKYLSDSQTQPEDNTENIMDSLKKKIIVSIVSPNILDSVTIGKIYESLGNRGHETVVLVNQPEEILAAEVNGNDKIPIFVSTMVDTDLRVSGNVYYNSVPLDNLYGPEAEEAMDILVTVKFIIEQGLAMQDITTDNSFLEETETQTPTSAEPPKKIVISTNIAVFIPDLDANKIGQIIESTVGIETVLLLNQPAESVQAELGGPITAILLDMKVDETLEVSGNIYKNFIPIDNLQGSDFDEALAILTTVKTILSDSIRAAVFATATEVSDIMTTIEPVMFDSSDSMFAEHTENPSQDYENFFEESQNQNVHSNSFADISPLVDVKMEDSNIQDFNSDIDVTVEPYRDELVAQVSTDDSLVPSDISLEHSPKPEPEPESEPEPEPESSPEPEPEAKPTIDATEGRLEHDIPNHIIQQNIDIENHGLRGFVTEQPRQERQGPSTPGVDFGLIKEITS